MDILSMFFALPVSDQRRISKLYKSICRLGAASDETLKSLVEARYRLTMYRVEHSRQVRAETVRADWK